MYKFSPCTYTIILLGTIVKCSLTLPYAEPTALVRPAQSFYLRNGEGEEVFGQSFLVFVEEQLDLESCLGW